MKPLNFGVEYCVFKWPEKNWNKAWYSLINKEVSLINVCLLSLLLQGFKLIQMDVLLLGVMMKIDHFLESENNLRII